MAQNLDPQVVSTIVAVASRPSGATLNDIIVALPQKPNQRKAHRWVTGMVEAGRLRVDATSMPYVYFAAAPDSSPTSPVDVASSPTALPSGVEPPAPVAPSNRKPDRPPHKSAAPKEAPEPISAEAAVVKAAVTLLTPVIAAAIPSADPGTGAGAATATGQKQAANEVANQVRKFLPQELKSAAPYAIGLLVLSLIGLASRLAFSYPLTTLGVVAILAAGVWLAIKVPAYLSKSQGSATNPDLDMTKSPGVTNSPGAAGPDLDMSKSATPQGVVTKSSPVSKSAAMSNSPGAVTNPELDMTKSSGVASSPGVAGPDLDMSKSMSKSATPQGVVTKSSPVSRSAAMSKSLGAVTNPELDMTRSPGMSKSPGDAPDSDLDMTKSSGVTNSSGIAGPDLDMSKSAAPQGVVTKSCSVSKSAAVSKSAPSAPPALASELLAPDSVHPGSSNRIQRTRYLILAGCAVLIAAVIGLAWYLQVGKRPTQADVSAMLVKSLAPLPVRVAALDLTYGAVGNTGCPVNFKVQFETTQPLVRKIDPTEYLRAHYPSEMAAIAAADALLRGPDGARLRAETSRVPDDQKPGVPAAGDSGPPVLGPSGTPALGSSGTPVLVSVSAPPGALTSGSGNTNAWQQNGVWVFTGTTLSVDRKALVGEPKPAGSLVVELPEDAAQLKAWVNDRVAYAAKVQAAARTLAAELGREREQRAEALTQLIARGSWFTGVVTNTAKSAANGVLLEVTGSSATTHQITLDLRNDRGVWTNTRPFKGDWSLNADGETVTVNVRTTIFDRIANGGPVLDDTGAIYLTLQVRLDGTVNVNVREWRLERVADSDVAKTKLAYGWTAAGVRSQDSGAKEAARASANIEHPTSNVEVAAPPALGSSGTLDSPPSAVGHLPSVASAKEGPSSGSGTRDLGASGPQDSPPSAVGPLPSGAGLPALGSSGPPAAAGAYARTSDGSWVPLPKNNGQIAFASSETLIAAINKAEKRAAAKTASNNPPDVVGTLRFDGTELPPTVSGSTVEIAFVGEVPTVSADVLEEYPVLKTTPLVEVAPLATGRDGTRSVPIVLIAPDFIGFGPNRVAATLTHPSPGVTLLTFGVGQTSAVRSQPSASGSGPSGLPAFRSSGTSASPPSAVSSLPSDSGPPALRSSGPRFAYALLCNHQSWELIVE